VLDTKGIVFHLKKNNGSNRRQSTVNNLRLPDVIERQELSLNLLSKLIMSLILEKYLVVLENS